MSGPAPATYPDRDPALDEGVLRPAPLIEFNGCTAVARLGGAAVLPWRRAWLGARAGGIVAEPEPPHGGRFDQALVRIHRGRAGTEADLAAAAQALAGGGELAVTGPNALGISGWIRRLAERLGAPTRERARAKARVAVFALPAGATLPAPAPTEVPLSDNDLRTLTALPGVFSGDGLDRGTALLIEHLAELPPARRVVDLGCGAGHLGIAALLAWPEATAVLADGDHRAVASAAANLARFSVSARGEARWWDAAEELAGGPFDLALINPPAHEGAEVSLGPAQAMLRSLRPALVDGGRVLLVANRRLPYERELGAFGACRLARERDGFKIIATGG